MTAQDQASVVSGDQTRRESASGVPPLPRWLLWGRWIAPLILLALIGVVALSRFHLPGARELKGGAVASGKIEAPDFVLTDQLGRQQQLSAFKGKPVALTFIYTNCADVCPLIAWNMHLAYQDLGDQAKNVVLMAVSVDPERDNVAQIKAFSDQRQLTNEWYFMTGNRPVLEEVWKEYRIGAQPVGSDGTQIPQNELGRATPEEVEHSAPLYLIDKAGNLRMMMPVDFTPENLSNNLRVLLQEG